MYLEDYIHVFKVILRNGKRRSFYKKEAPFKEDIYKGVLNQIEPDASQLMHMEVTIWRRGKMLLHHDCHFIGRKGFAKIWNNKIADKLSSAVKES